jgi:hypothetical protein
MQLENINFMHHYVYYGLEQINISHNFIINIDFLNSFTNLKIIDASNNYIE